MTPNFTEPAQESISSPQDSHARPELLSEEQMRSLVDWVGSRIYEPIAQFKITAWRTPEPVTFENRFKGEKIELHRGDSWGEQLFDCAWFQFTAELPLGVSEQLVARIDINGELYISDEYGNPVRGLTCKESVFERTLGTPSKVIYALPKDSVREQRLELWADAAFNDLFGSLSCEGRIEMAEVCVCRYDLRDLYYDLEVLVDLLLGVKETDAFRAEASAAISQAALVLGECAPEAVSEARALLKPFFHGSAKPKSLRVSAIGHAHLDLAWLWPIRETIRKGARTFATALYNIERYPEYVFGCSQPQLFAWMKEFYPALYSRIKKAVKQGRIELLGTFWVEPDCNVPCGESFVRQVLHGAAFFREEFGIVPDFCWQPDVFGYHGQLPQILSKSGHRYFMTQKLSWNVVNRFPHHSFHWEGIDGSRILTHMLPEETYNGPAAPHSLRKIGNEYAQREVSDHALMVFGIGDGGGGPDAEHIERLRRVRALPGLPRAEIKHACEFFKEWAVAADRFPCWQGELYLERHQGTLTTQALTKRNNRRCEIALREFEWVSFLANRLAAAAYPQPELDRLWKEVLLYQFHDILPGSSIKRVYDEANARYALILEELEKLIAERYQAVAQSIDSTGRHLVFNSLPWPRQQWLKLDDQWWLVKMPGMGYATPERVTMGKGLFAAQNRLENERLRVEFAHTGALVSIFDKSAGREILAPGAQGNQFVICPDAGDAWDFETNLQEKDVWIYLRQKVEHPVLHSRATYIDGPCAVIEQTFMHGASRIHQRVLLREGEENLEFDTKVEWAEPKTMLRVRFPVAVTAAQARFEIPFGSIARSTAEESSVQKAQIEVPAQQWVDLSEPTYGVALLNDCKYGFRVKGHTLDMCLIRSVPHPGTALIGKDDKAEANPGGECTDLTEHSFRYALRPHLGKASEAELTKAAREFNCPVRAVACKPNAGAAPKGCSSWLEVSNPAIEIPAIKRAEDGNGWILRLVNVMPAEQQCRVEFKLPFKSIVETDLAEQAVGKHRGGDAVALAFAPFEIKSFRCLSDPST